MTARPVETVTSELLTVPIVPPPVSSLLLAGLDLAPRRRIPAWITDPGLIASIVAGHVDIPDDLLPPPTIAERVQFAACLAHVVLAARVAELEAAVAVEEAVR